MSDCSNNTTMTKEIQDKIDTAALAEHIYEPKYGGKDHSGYGTMMKYEINYEREEAFSNGATFGYNLAQEEIAELKNMLRVAKACWKEEMTDRMSKEKEIERLKKFIEDTFWERHDRNSIPDAEAWQQFKTENNL